MVARMCSPHHIWCWKLGKGYLKSFPFTYLGHKPHIGLGGSKKPIFFGATWRSWNNHLHIQIWTDIFKKYRYGQMKVVIPRTGMGWKKTVFLRPHHQYEVSDRDIWGKKTSDNPFQVSNTICDGGYTCGQPLLTEVVEIVKKLLFWSFFLIFPIVEANLSEICLYYGENEKKWSKK